MAVLVIFPVILQAVINRNRHFPKYVVHIHTPRRVQHTHAWVLSDTWHLEQRIAIPRFRDYKNLLKLYFFDVK